LTNFIRTQLQPLFDKPHGYKPQLDFLRFMAITLVFLTHSGIVFRNAFERNALTEFPVVLGGWVGVDLFFVLSGFLIGGQLWKEYKLSKRINYARFFIRRTLRIWPLYFFVLAVFLLIRGPLDPDWHYSDLYFFSNYFAEGGIMGSWSLAIEEQFYILLPILLLLMGLLKAPYKFGRYLALFMVAISPAIRYLTWSIITKNHTIDTMGEIKYLYFPFHTHMDGLFVGVFLANLYYDKELFAKRGKLIGLGLIIAAVILAVLRVKFRIGFSYTFSAFLFGAALWWSLYAHGWIMKLFSIEFFPLVARLSFGMYLMHFQLVQWWMPWVSGQLRFLPSALNFALSMAILYVFAMIAAAATYLIIESPALRWRDAYLKLD